MPVFRGDHARLYLPDVPEGGTVERGALYDTAVRQNRHGFPFFAFSGDKFAFGGEGELLFREGRRRDYPRDFCFAEFHSCDFPESIGDFEPRGI